MPTSTQFNGWTNYQYYISSSNSTAFMWYKDVVYGGEKYRGVYFTSYRPYWCNYGSSSTYQDDNGYSTGTRYWFKYEPIKWRVLTKQDGKAFLLCDIAIDSQEYYDNYNNRTINGSTVYANNYEYSNIRKWLNDNFYNTAFSSTQQALIQTTLVDNSARSTNPNNNASQWNSGKNPYACSNTNDKIFLLSEQEITNTAYGFNASYSASDTARRFKSSDYAKSQGCYASTSSSYLGNCYFWLRSPYYCSSNSARYVISVGNAGYSDYVYDSNYGVLPALWLDLSGGDTYTEEDGYIYFGSYPQTKVSDDSVISALNTASGDLPTSTQFNGWTNYQYYISSSNSTAFMWYKDVIYNGEKYRGVYFTSYRPDLCNYSSSSSNTFQDDNGYSTDTRYWFKYEPIKWRVLIKQDGKAFLLCDIAIDAQEYYNDYNNYRTINGSTVFVNNYEYSNIRKWLNDNFYNTAFSVTQQALIQTTLVDNSARSTNPNNNATYFNGGVNDYVCSNTNDKIFLLSMQEITNSVYGFSEDYDADDTARQFKSSDYANSQGCCAETYSEYEGNCCFLLRSPYYNYGDYARNVTSGGSAGGLSAVNFIFVGVLPALWLAL